MLDEEKSDTDRKNINTGNTSLDTEHDEESALCPNSGKNQKEKQNSQEKEECKQPWLTLASYVDELTVGGRRNSKGQFIDGMGTFPGFGNSKEAREPPDCFPPNCYQR